MKRLKIVQFKRRRQYKTDYLARATMLKGDTPRLVVRKTNRYLIAQLVDSKVAKDRVVFTVNSKDFTKYGWPKSESIKNLSAGYLLGTLFAVMAKKNKFDKAILDIGLLRSTKGNKVYAVAKGANDAGFKVNFSKEVAPSEERLMGSNVKTKVDVKKLKEQIMGKNG